MSAAAKHTPGPWKVGPLAMDERGCHAIEVAAGPVSVAWVMLGTKPTREEIAAGREDAALLSAAPEMLAALRKLMEWCTTFRDGDSAAPLNYVNDARAAIARATGGTP